MRRSLMIAAAAGLLAACSFFVPFSEYDSEPALPDAAPEAAIDAPAPPDAGTDAAQACDADTQIDRDNCGACGRRCLTPSGCTAGLCEAEGILGGDGNLYLTAVTADPAGIYVGGLAATKNGTIGALLVRTNTGSVAPIAVTTALPIRLSLTGTDLYWTQGPYSDAGANDRGVGHVSRMPLSDGGIVFGALYVTGQTNPYAITVDPSAVLFTDTVPGAVWTAALEAPANAHAIVNDPNTTFLAADGQNVFWSTVLPVGKVMRANRDGSGVQPVADNQKMPAALAVDQDYVYWTSYDADGAIYRAPKGGGAPLEIARGQYRPAVIAVDDTYVYWGNVGPDNGVAGSIARAPKGGGKTLVLAVNQKPSDLAVDGSYVWWPSGGVLYRVAK